MTSDLQEIRTRIKGWLNLVPENRELLLRLVDDVIALESERDTLKTKLESLQVKFDSDGVALFKMSKERDALKAFKAFVHKRLDQAGVPKEFPDGKHSKEGCRVGDRLDWLEAEWKRCWKQAVGDAEQAALAATGGVLAMNPELYQKATATRVERLARHFHSEYSKEFQCPSWEQLAALERESYMESARLTIAVLEAEP